MATKICKGCGIEKDLEEFHLSPTNKMGRHPYCKECRNWNHRSEQSKQRELELRDLQSKGLKRCSSCKEIKPVTEFPSSKNRPDGLHPYCFVCSRSKGLEYVRRPEVKQHKKERESTREFLDNLAEYRRTSKTYKETHRIYVETSPVFKEYQSAYNKKIDVRLRGKISCKIYAALKSQDESKMLEFDEYLGCTFEFFKQYISNLFQEGMSWDNWGRGSNRWHIDHIKPCASFNFHDINQQKECFHYTNQQPLWEHDNLSKSSKIGDKRHYHKRS
jgi:hypothetical protein